jgi:hypothetical protein
MKKKYINFFVLCLLIGPLLIYIICNVYISVSVLVFSDHLWIDYCDSFEINNNNAENEQDIQIRSEDNRDRRIPFDSVCEENIKEFTLKEKVKLRLYWHVWERHKNKYRSYKELKKSWDPNQSIRSEIKQDIKDDLDKLRLFKATASWFLSPKVRKDFRRRREDLRKR